MLNWAGWIKTSEKHIAILISSICLTLLLLNFDFNFLEANLFDLRVSHGHQTQADSEIALIVLDDATKKEFDEFAPLPMDAHVQLLNVLQEAKPTGVGYLVDMNHVDQVTQAPIRNNAGKAFFNAAKKLTSSGIPFLLGTPFDVTGEVLPPQPLKSLPHAVAVIHKDGNVFAEDKITRRALLTLYGRHSFHLEFAKQIQKKMSRITNEDPRGTFYIHDIDSRYFFFRYHGSTVQNQRALSQFPYPAYSFKDIIAHRVNLQLLKNKMILVGTLSSDDSADYALTPYSKKSFTNPKILIHANILDSILHHDGIDRAPHALNGLVTFLVTTCVLWWILNSTPVYGVFATLTLALALIMVSQAFFQIKGLWIRESQPLVGIFVSYYLAVPYRLILEYKKRWEYQQKNELFVEVEELKTNFLSLVTHDLKTPVARIQGLAEMTLRDGYSEENLKNIVSSTDQLNHFISSILELSRIETSRLRLQLESKDINQLIEKSVDSFQAQAKGNGIEILTQLEPLFPIKLDVSLISKVLNNLIDNALKYSFPKSRIQICSKEEGDFISITVQDHGIGISELEQESLFTRFYRAKNDLTTSIAGTGLGLYLSRFFIEAHEGSVEVKSQRGIGTTFKIFLPIQLTQSKENLHV